MLLAAIDIGTVTARLALAQVEDGRVIRMAKYTEIVNLRSEERRVGKEWRVRGSPDY